MAWSTGLRCPLLGITKAPDLARLRPILHSGGDGDVADPGGSCDDSQFLGPFDRDVPQLCVGTPMFESCRARHDCLGPGAPGSSCGRQILSSGADPTRPRRMMARRSRIPGVRFAQLPSISRACGVSRRRERAAYPHRRDDRSDLAAAGMGINCRLRTLSRLARREIRRRPRSGRRSALVDRRRQPPPSHDRSRGRRRRRHPR